MIDSPPTFNPESGMSLAETLVALVLLSVLVVAFGGVLIHGAKQLRETDVEYQAITVLRNFVAEVEAIGNQTPDIENGIGIGALYRRFHNQTLTNLDLPGAEIDVTCFPNEPTVPAQFGGPQDLNLDGDAEDVVGSSNGTDLKLVPMEIALVYEIDGTSRSLVINRLFTKKSD